MKLIETKGYLEGPLVHSIKLQNNGLALVALCNVDPKDAQTLRMGEKVEITRLQPVPEETP